MTELLPTPDIPVISTRAMLTRYPTLVLYSVAGLNEQLAKHLALGYPSATLHISGF